MKAAAAFLVFAGFGLIVRYILSDQVEDQLRKPASEHRPTNIARASGGLDVIVPGTSVADLLGSADNENE